MFKRSYPKPSSPLEHSNLRSDEGRTSEQDWLEQLFLFVQLGKFSEVIIKTFSSLPTKLVVYDSVRCDDDDFGNVP